MAKQPSRDDVSKPKAHGYAYKKQFYQSADVAADYDEHRFRTPKRQRRNARKWNAIQKALALTTGVKTVVDLPCGTGRFTGHLARGLHRGRQRHLGRNDAAGGEAPERAAREHRRLRARRRRSHAVPCEVRGLRDEHPFSVPRRSRDTPPHAARIRPRIAPLG